MSPWLYAFVLVFVWTMGYVAPHQGIKVIDQRGCNEPPLTVTVTPR